MKKVVLLTCDDVSDYVIDEDLLIEALDSYSNSMKIEMISWSKPDVDWSNFDVAVVRTTWDYTKKLNSFLNVMKKIENSGCKLLNPCEILKWNSDKIYLKELQENGVSTVPSVFLQDEDKESFCDKLQSVSAEKFVLKPLVGASASEIKIFKLEEAGAVWNGLSNKKIWFVQPFIEEVFDGEISCIFYNGAFSHSARKVPKEGDFRVQAEHGSSIIEYTPSKEELLFATEIANKFAKDLLYARVDFLKTSKAFLLMELELIEPSLYFRVVEGSAEGLAKAIDFRLQNL